VLAALSGGGPGPRSALSRRRCAAGKCLSCTVIRQPPGQRLTVPTPLSPRIRLPGPTFSSFESCFPKYTLATTSPRDHRRTSGPRSFFPVRLEENGRSPRTLPPCSSFHFFGAAACLRTPQGSIFSMSSLPSLLRKRVFLPSISAFAYFCLHVLSAGARVRQGPKLPAFLPRIIFPAVANTPPPFQPLPWVSSEYPTR